jgi:hypothetical protein
MARGYISTLLNALPGDIKKILIPAFDYVTDNGKLGPIEDGKRATNFQIYWFAGTTSTTANGEFSIKHGMGEIPGYIITGAPLNAANWAIVPLAVSRAADAERVYLTSSSTGASVFVGLGF